MAGSPCFLVIISISTHLRQFSRISLHISEIYKVHRGGVYKVQGFQSFSESGRL